MLGEGCYYIVTLAWRVSVTYLNSLVRGVNKWYANIAEYN